MEQEIRLEGRRVLVTGAARGLGESFARALVASGARVVISDVLHERGQSLAAELGAQASYVPLDLLDPAGIRDGVDQAAALMGGIDGLINNAAYFREVKLTPFEEIDPAIWERIFRVNVQGVWNCCKAVMPAMRAQQSGAIVNIASVVAVAGQPGYLHYVASKGAVLAMTDRKSVV